MHIELPGYKIKSALGKGGMATVYLAIQESFDREVALKVMSPDLQSDPSFGERFLREAKIVSRLVHPNIVSVYDVGIHSGYYFLSMEYVPGKDLTHKYSELSLVDRLRVIKDIARALDFAGKKGYVHRDVKPENIMLHEEDGRAVLMDFGIARPSDTASGVTQVGTAIGTPHYMSPEQAKGLAVDARADLYSLGVVLFLMVTGHVPYDGESAVVVGIMHISEDIPCLPPYLEAFQPIIDKIMAKNPDRRYQSGAEFIAALEAIPAATLASIAEASLQADKEGVAASKPVKAIEKKAKVHNATEFEQNTSMVARSEDRIAQHKTHPPQKSGPRWSTLFLSLIVLAAVGYYFQNDIQQRWFAASNSSLSVPLVEKPVVNASAPAGADFSAESRAEITTAPVKSQTEIPAVTRSVFIEQANALRESLKQDWSVAPELAVLYRAASNGTNPVEQQAAKAGLDELQHFYAAHINTALQENATDSAQVYADSANSVFGDDEKISSLQDALASLDSAKATNEQLRQKVLQEQAQQQQLAQQQQQEKQNELKQKQQKQKLLEQELVNKAKALQAAGKLIAPGTGNALKTYRELLTQNAQHAEAREGVINIENDVVKQISQLISEEKYNEASEQLVNARESFPQSKSLLGLSIDLERAISDNVPVVSRLLVTSDEVNQLAQQQEPAIAAERIIYIGFEYRNFNGDASVLQAILYDGSRSLQIAQVPVVINGAKGLKFFRIEQPVAGFADGGYNIELLFKQEPLISAKFSVKK